MNSESATRKPNSTPEGTCSDRSFGCEASNTSDGDQLLGQYIPLHYHYQMLLDESRVGGFEQAILRAVPEGGKVVELGAGTGILSSFAAKKASKVWSVERNPQMFEVAKGLISSNQLGDRVEVILADAREYCPPEEVDVVICEMLHSALLREKQVQVIEAFKKNYQARFGSRLPLFIPEATILAAQPVQQKFDFHGYHAPITLFFEPHDSETNTVGLTDPLVYSFFEYRNACPPELKFDGTVKIADPGELNAIRFVTKNVLNVNLQENTTVDWHNFYLVLPLPTPIKVKTSDRISIKFSYSAGDPIEALSSSLSVSAVAGAPS